MTTIRRSMLLLLMGVLSFGVLLTTAQDNKDGFPTPDLVTLPGSFQDELGCAGEWQPDCENTAMSFNEDSGLWEASFEIPAGTYEYKVALNGTWDVNYGANGEVGGANIALELAEDMSVDFTYDHATGNVSDSVNGDAVVADEDVMSEAMFMPELVNVPGTIQAVLGCPGEWAPDCLDTALELNEEYGIFERTFENIPAGGYEYKVAINGSWDENYGGFADAGGGNITLTVPEDQPITFIYDPANNWIMDNIRHDIVTAPGSYQDEVGCSGEWMPECMATWLQDVDGDGIYTFSTDDIPAGDYEVKAAINRSWDENYGEGGELDGGNITFSVPTDGTTVSFVYDSNITTMVVNVGGGGLTGASLREQRAHWVLADTIAWDVEADDSLEYKLLASEDANMSVSLFGLDGDFEAFDLSINPDGLPVEVTDKFPHLAGFTAFTLNEEALGDVDEILQTQIAIAAFSGENVVNLTGLQIPGVLDDLYTTDTPLGVNVADNAPLITVWAPTAIDVSLNLYADSDPDTEPELIEMERGDDGVWGVIGTEDWMGQYYTFNVEVYAPSELAIVQNEVTDPYSVNLSQNSLRSHIFDITDPAFMPDGWADIEKPALDAPEDITVYELHMRDFSVADETVPDELKGTYLAFTLEDSDGMAHLQALADAGLTHLHLLPTFDIATINENRSRTDAFSPDFADLAEFDSTSEEQQATINQVRDLDAFNWGYDPYHFFVPEGSYSTNPDDETRVVEYREMVMSVNEMGLRFVQDVVFNHTNASGQNARSVFDRIVPGYYHRLNSAGRVETSTCCQNTATEHNMMRRLMVDTVVLNAVYYKVDAFRFDLMGHHMLDDMIEVREALDSLTIEEHGIDGTEVYVYGEGWDFGEVGQNARGVNATQFNSAGTGIGTFNDRLRDAIRGGSPFGDRDQQGLGNGIYNFPNAMSENNESLDRALLLADLTRVGLAGNLQNYEFTDRNGNTAVGLDVDYNGSPAGYALDPQENIVYVSKHDNETLFDNMLFRLPEGTTMDDIVRMQNLSLSYVMYSQGIPFFHAGSDLLRSKSMDRNSYNSGDWFNVIDWTYQDNNFGVGLPPAQDNQDRWEWMTDIMSTEEYYPEPEDIALNRDVFQEMLQVRYSTPLFRLQTAEDVQARLAFHNTGADQAPGVIVMSISDLEGDDLDPNHELVVVVFNADNEAIELSLAELEGVGLELHPVLAESADDVVQGASFDAETGTLRVPALTTAVFVLPE